MNESRLILALDVTDREKAISISKKVSEFVYAIKIGYPLVLSSGLDIITQISEYAPIIADFKVADIPNTNRLICSLAFESGANGIIVHGFTGYDSVLECVKISKKYNKDVFVVTEMSHPGAVEFMQKNAIKIAELAVKLNATGVVAPGTRLERLKKIRETVGELKIISPGVGLQGGNARDVIKSGADYVIVGRSIYNSKSPEKVAEKIANLINQ